MTGRTQFLIGVVCACTMSGCRTAARIVQEPRVDFDVTDSTGNRGYFVGAAPALPAQRRDTRQVMEAEVELPNFSAATVSGSPPVESQEAAAPQEEMTDQTATLQEIPLDAGIDGRTFDEYVVKNGDTLWSIAADPQVLGDASQWRALFEANRDKLRSPDQLRKGMVLRIPRGDTPAQTVESTPEPQFTK